MKQITDFIDNPEERTISEVFVSVLRQRRDYDFPIDNFQCDLDGYGSRKFDIDLDAISPLNKTLMVHNRFMMMLLRDYAFEHYNAVIDHWDKTGHDYFHRDMGSTAQDFAEIFKKYNLPE